MSAPLVPIITRAGLAACRNAQMTGLLATIKFVAVGRGLAAGAGYAGYTPAGTETALRSEVARVQLLYGAALGGVAGSAPIGFRVLARIPALAPGAADYPIEEVGFFLDDGTLLCLWSDPAFPVAYRTTLSDTDLALDLFLSALPTTSLAITVLEPDVPDTTGILASLLRAVAVVTTAEMQTRERLARLGL